MVQKATLAELIEHTVSVPDKHAVAPDYAIGRLLARGAGFGAWRMALPEGDLAVSPKAREIYGLDPATNTISLGTALERLHKGDRTRVAKVIMEALNERCGFHYVCGITDFRNRNRMIECFGDIELAADNTPRALVGTVQDVTELHNARRTASSRMLLIRALMKHVPLAVAILDAKMRYLAVSDFWVAGHGFETPEQLVGKSHYDLFDIPEPMRMEHRQVLNGITLQRPRAFLKDSDGNPIEQLATMAPWYAQPNQVGGIILMLSKVDKDNRADLDPNDAGPAAGEFEDLLKELAGAG